MRKHQPIPDAIGPEEAQQMADFPAVMTSYRKARRRKRWLLGFATIAVLGLCMWGTHTLIANSEPMNIKNGKSWLVALSLLGTSQAQDTSVGINEASPHPGTVLELESTEAGLRLSRMTTAQRDALLASGSTADSVELRGLTIYNLTTHCVEYFNRYEWISLCRAASPCEEVYSMALDDNEPCEGSTLMLSSTHSFTQATVVNYSWEGPNGFTSSSQNPFVTSNAATTDNGDYILTAALSNGCVIKDTLNVEIIPTSVVCGIGPNLITNADFSGGDTGFTTEYSNTASIFSAGAYRVGTNPNALHGSWCNMGDHTDGSGNMLIANGSGTIQNVWCQTVSVSPDTRYQFSFWVSNVCTICGDTPQYQVLIDNEAAAAGCASVTTGPICTWTQLVYNFKTDPGQTSANFCIQNVLTTSGNDFAFDDFSLTQCP